jgi:imidazole glycerol-phosphate synthase subunit HisH
MALVAVIDYGSGNLRSAAKAFERAARDSGADDRIEVTGDPATVARADRIVLPGVGAFADCRRGLADISGMEQALAEAVREKGRPFLGICVGMQLLATCGREFETVAGLGWIAGEVAALHPNDPSLKIPHMGWNELRPARPHPLLAGLEPGTHAYFVHSFGFFPARAEDVLATVEYGGAVVASLARDNIAGVQFHPEKSQGAGLRVIANFLGWRP